MLNIWIQTIYWHCKAQPHQWKSFPLVVRALYSKSKDLGLKATGWLDDRLSLSSLSGWSIRKRGPYIKVFFKIGCFWILCLFIKYRFCIRKMFLVIGIPQTLIEYFYRKLKGLTYSNLPQDLDCGIYI